MARSEICRRGDRIRDFDRCLLFFRKVGTEPLGLRALGLADRCARRVCLWTEELDENRDRRVSAPLRYTSVSEYFTRKEALNHTYGIEKGRR